MDAGTPKKVPYRWFLRLTEPANPPRMIKQKVAPQPSSPTQKGRRVKKRFSALLGEWKFSTAPTFALCGKWEPLRLILLTLSQA